MTNDKIPSPQPKLLKKYAKAGIIMLSALAASSLCAVLVYNHMRDHAAPSEASCLSGAATTFAPPLLANLISNSSVIVLADEFEASQSDHVFKVRENIKGENLKINDTFTVCSEVSKVGDGSLDSAIFFLKGFDESQNMWVPVQFEAGIIPKLNGKYEIASEDSSLSLNEIRKAIKDQK